MANTQLFDNNAVTSLAAGITAVATTMTVQTGEGALFATVASPDTMLLTLDDGAGNIEIVKVTTHTAAADTFTIVRQQEGTTGFAFSINDPVDTAGGQLQREHASPDLSVLDKLEKREVEQRIQGCINALDNEFKEVIVLRDIQGFSYDEISDMLEIAGGTVKSRLHRARESVRSCLKKFIGDM